MSGTINYETGVETDARLFVAAIGSMIEGSYEQSWQLLKSCSVQDHVVENYSGEVSALMGKIDQAYRHFWQALQLNPLYSEPNRDTTSVSYYNKKPDARFRQTATSDFEPFVSYTLNQLWEDK